MKKLLVFLVLVLLLALPSGAFATKIADTMMAGLNEKTELATTSIASGDLIPLYDDTDAAWKVIDASYLETAAQVETRVGTSTAAELNFNDTSAQTSTVIAGGAVSNAIMISRLDASAGAGTITLAAPAAAMEGRVKVIEYTGGGTNALTMALTNVVGGSAATSASFNADNETLILVGGKNKWVVTGEAGVTLS